MIRKITTLCVVLVSSLYSLSACDSCASGLNSSGVGLLSTYRQNFVGLSWQRSMFDSSSTHSTGSKDRFQTLELRIRYQISDRWSVTLGQPFKYNKRIEEGGHRVLKGISDTKLFVNYSILQNEPVGDDLALSLESSIGIKLAVGDYRPSIQDENLPENFNLSNGAYGYILQMTPVLTKGNIGLLGNVYYQHNFKSSNDYQFGNQFSTQWVMFYRKTIAEKYTLLPFAGIQYEHVTQDHYATEYEVNGTGGSGLYAVTAVNFKADKGSLELSYNIPITGSFSGDEVDAKGKIGAMATLFF